jgi:hypothetical protein
VWTLTVGGPADTDVDASEAAIALVDVADGIW